MKVSEALWRALVTLLSIIPDELADETHLGNGYLWL